MGYKALASDDELQERPAFLRGIDGEGPEVPSSEDAWWQRLGVVGRCGLHLQPEGRYEATIRMELELEL